MPDPLRLLLARLVVALARRLPQPPQPPEAPPMPDPMDDLDPRLVARWHALPPGPFGWRLYALGTMRGARVISPDTLALYDKWAEAEHRDDGADDLGGIAGLAWRLMVGD